MPNQSGKIILVLFLACLLVLGVSILLFGLKSDKPRESLPTPVPGIKYDYESEATHAVFKVPSDAIVTEKNSSLLITLPNGEISIISNGTNFETPKEYFEDLQKKNKIHELSNKEDKTVKGYRYVMSSDDQKERRSYFVYSENTIFAFSTSNKRLYSVMDEIVQSFEYRP